MHGARVAHAVARWILVLLGILAAALCCVAICAWGIGGPSPGMLTLRSYRTEAHFCYAGALLAVGVAVFLAVRAGRFTRASILLAAAAVVLFATPPVREFWAADSCLDGGGRWNSSSFACEK